MDELKVIFHIDEREKWNLTLMNIENFIGEEEDSEIICLANAEAVKDYRQGSHSQSELEELLDRGIKFLACGNALRNFGIDESQLVEGIDIVPAGVVELARKQGEGYAYIRP